MKLFNRFRKTIETDTTATPTSIYDFARQLGDRFTEVAHPSELARDEAFLAAVRALAASEYGFDELVTFTHAESAAIASLAVMTLAERGDRDAVTTLLLEQINTLSGNWTKFFALEALDRLHPPPQLLLGRVIAALNEDWSDGYERFQLQFIRELARRRFRAGERPSFEGALTGLGSNRRSDVSELLRKLDRDVAAPLREELTAFEQRSTNVDYLRGVGLVWDDTTSAQTTAIEHEGLIEAAALIEQTLTGERRRSLLVVGEDGVGKSTIIRAAAQRLRAAGWVVFEAGATELISGQQYVGQLEQRMQKLLRSIGGARRRVLWIVPRFHELMHAGAYRYNPNGVLDFILPEVDSGSIAILGEIGASAYEKLVEQKPRIRSGFVTVRVQPSSESATLALAERWAAVHSTSRPLLDAAVLREAWQLTTQYLGMRAAPGNLLGLLELTHARLRANGAEEPSITVDDLLVTLSQMTGLPNSILDDREGLDLAALREQFSSRVLGQQEAIDGLVERVAMIKAGVTDPTRPFGVFLFAGPTGTGKTEIAKALAEYLFGSAERMLRVDMSELKDVESLGRLVGDRDDGTATSLVQQVRKQPFSVVLLDEIEKAHPNVWDLFLQVFDDGRLTDRRGVTADFRHSLIIMTSNVGSAIQTSGRVGFSESAGSAFQLAKVRAALEREFRKEFLNRIDRVVVFRPLALETMRGILRKELSEAFRRRGLRNRNWAVEWDEQAVELLLREGFTEDLGARPLKRAVERHLLTPLAELIVTRRIPTGDQFLFIRAENGKLEIDFVDPDANVATETIAPVADDVSLESLVLDARGTNVEVERLRRAYTALAGVVEGDEWSARKSIALSMTALPEFWTSSERFAILGEAETRDRIEHALAGAGSVLDRLRGAPADVVRRIARQLWLIGIAIDDLREQRASEAFLLIEARPDVAQIDATNGWARRVAAMYRQWARTRGMRLEVIEESADSRDAYRLLITVSGFGAHTLLARESGLHVLEVPGAGGNTFDRLHARVRVAPAPPTPPAETREAASRALNGTHENVVVRRYRESPSALVRDSVRNWRTGRIDVVLGGGFDVMA